MIATSTREHRRAAGAPRSRPRAGRRPGVVRGHVVVGLVSVVVLGCLAGGVGTAGLPEVAGGLAQAAGAAPADAPPRTWFVATTGRDEDPGSESRPFRTVGRGVKALAPGDTLYIRAGTYPESLMNAIPGGTSWERPVRVAAFPGDGSVILKPEPGATRVLHFEGPRTAYISVEDLVLDGSHVTYDAVKITYGRETRDAAHHIRLLRCEVRNAPMQGILVTTGANDNELLQLNIHDNGTTDFGHGVYITSERNLLEDSLIHRNAGWGVHVYSQPAIFSAHFNVVRRNRVWDNARAGKRGTGIVVRGGWGNQVIENVVSGNRGGIEVGPLAPDTLLRDNVVFGNGPFEVLVHWLSFGSRVESTMPAGARSERP